MSKGIEKYIPDPSEAMHIASAFADIIVPPVGIAGHGAAGVIGFVEKRQQVKRERIEKDTKRILERAYERNRKENYELDEEQLDLFFEVVEAALRDDEEIKRELFYDPIVSWIASRDTKQIMIRPLVNAVRSLSAIELFAFIVELKDAQGIFNYLLNQYTNDRITNRKVWTDYSYSRFIGAGLSADGEKRSLGNGTPLATLLRTILEHDGYDERDYAEKLGLEYVER